MSYDLIFLPRRNDQSWQDALDAAELVEDYGGPLPSEKWRKIVELARTQLPNCRDTSSAEQNALEDDDTGIELSATLIEASVSVPYWHAGEQAAHVIRTMYMLGEMISQLADLDGYDQQIDWPAVAQNVDYAIQIYEEHVRAIH
jgi:hypothetical protein